MYFLKATQQVRIFIFYRWRNWDPEKFKSYLSRHRLRKDSSEIWTLGSLTPLSCIASESQVKALTEAERQKKAVHGELFGEELAKLWEPLKNEYVPTN